MARYYLLERDGVNWPVIDGPFDTNREATAERERRHKATTDAQWEDFQVVSRSFLKDRYPTTEEGERYLDEDIQANLEVDPLCTD